MTDATVDIEPSDLQPPAAGGSAPTDEQQGDPAELGEGGLRALQAERTARQEAERQLREAQAQLTSSAARITELEAGSGDLIRERDTAASEALRYRVAYTRGVPAEAFDLLQGTDEATLGAGADRLLSLMGARASTPAARVAADPSQGSRTPAPQTAEAQFKAALGGILG